MIIWRMKNGDKRKCSTISEEGENLLCVRNNMKVSTAKTRKDSARETHDEVGKATTS